MLFKETYFLKGVEEQVGQQIELESKAQAEALAIEKFHSIKNAFMVEYIEFGNGNIMTDVKVKVKVETEIMGKPTMKTVDKVIYRIESN